MTASEFRSIAQGVISDIDLRILNVRAYLSRLAMNLHRASASRLRWNDSVARWRHDQALTMSTLRSLCAQALDARMLILRAKPTTYMEVLTALRRKIHVAEWGDLPRPE